MGTQQQVRRRKRRRRRRYLIARIVLWTLIIAILTAIIVLAVTVLKSLSFNGKWMRDVDLTEEYVANTAIWLSDVQDVEIDKAWVEDRSNEIIATSVLTLKSGAFLNGNYIEEIDSASYTDCKNIVYDEVSSMMREIIKERLVFAGYADEVSDAEADALISEMLGMDMRQYLEANAITFIPSFEELSADVSRSGSYTIGMNSIKWVEKSSGSETEDKYTKDGNIMIFTDKPVLYRKQVRKQ